MNAISLWLAGMNTSQNRLSGTSELVGNENTQHKRSFQQNPANQPATSFDQMLAMALMNGGIAPTKTLFDVKNKKPAPQPKRQTQHGHYGH
jgi:hypothetical protein